MKLESLVIANQNVAVDVYKRQVLERYVEFLV